MRARGSPGAGTLAGGNTLGVLPPSNHDGFDHRERHGLEGQARRTEQRHRDGTGVDRTKSGDAFLIETRGAIRAPPPAR